MRILVVSDSHGDLQKLNDAIRSQSSAEIVLHLGDGEDELQAVKSLYPDKSIIGVKGNCDFCSALPANEEFTFGKAKIFMTHGNLYNVKLGFSAICAKARSVNANVLLFGHTHYAFCEYQSGLYIMNPGSLKMGMTYGTLDIEENGIVTNIVHLDKHNEVFAVRQGNNCDEL